MRCLRNFDARGFKAFYNSSAVGFLALEIIRIEDASNFGIRITARFRVRNFIPNATSEALACVLLQDGTGFSTKPLPQAPVLCFPMRYNISGSDAGSLGSELWASPDSGQSWVSPEFNFIPQLAPEQGRKTRLLKLAPTIFERGTEAESYVGRGQSARLDRDGLQTLPVAPSTVFVAL